MQLGETRIHGNSALVCLRAGIVTTGFIGAGGRIDVAGNILPVLGTASSPATTRASWTTT